ncbi:MAG: hypothetical protein WD491_10155 [Balneolales bacterium]
MKLLKIFVLAIFVGLLIGFIPNFAKAQESAVINRDFGIGLMLGEPSGVTVKSWNSIRSAFDIGAAWSLSGRNESVHLHSDYLLHNWFPDTQGLGFYYGVGGRVIFSGDATAGVRVPIGLTYIFQNAPLDAFVEAVPIFDVTPNTEFAGNGAVGIRYYF